MGQLLEENIQDVFLLGAFVILHKIKKKRGWTKQPSSPLQKFLEPYIEHNLHTYDHI